MSKWDEASLGQAIDILSGYAFKSKDFCQRGVPVLKIQNITNAGVILDKDTVCVSGNLAMSLPKYQVQYDDILITMTGSHISQINSVVGKVGKVQFNDYVQARKKLKNFSAAGQYTEKHNNKNNRRNTAAAINNNSHTNLRKICLKLMIPICHQYISNQKGSFPTYYRKKAKFYKKTAS